MISQIQNMKLFDFKHTIARELFESYIYPFEVLEKIKEYILLVGKLLPKSEFYSPKESVWISKGAIVEDSTFLGDCCIICDGAKIRHGAYIRGNAIVGQDAVVGNSTELKNVILFDGVQVPHFNYIGDSILGYRVHLGAGAVTSNVKGDRTNVAINGRDFQMQTNLRKCGVFLGDYVEVGCNCVLNPGCVVGVKSRIYPLCSVRGVIDENVIYKNEKDITKIAEKI